MPTLCPLLKAYSCAVCCSLPPCPPFSFCYPSSGTHPPRGGGFSHVKVWSRTLRSEGVTPKEAEKDAAEVRARAAFGACVSAINAVDSLSYRFAEVSEGCK